jgi:hypothetical protein
MKKLASRSAVAALAFAAVVASAGAARADDAAPTGGDFPPFQLDPIWDGLFMRVGVLTVGGGAVLSGEPEGLGPALDVHLVAAARESNAQHWEALRFDYLFSNRGHRLGGTLADFDEIVIGADGDGAPCLPALFVAWPDGNCSSTSGLLGFGLKLLQVDHEFPSEVAGPDRAPGATGLRIAEGNLRLVAPGAAHGPGYPRFRLPIFAGAALDWVSDGVGAIPRFVGGADVFVRTDDSHVEATFHAAVRPSFLDPSNDLLFEATGRLVFRWVAPWAGPFALQGLSLETGWGYAATPGVSIGERFSRTEPHSAWMILGFELTTLKIGPG